LNIGEKFCAGLFAVAYLMLIYLNPVDHTRDDAIIFSKIKSNEYICNNPKTDSLYQIKGKNIIDIKRNVEFLQNPQNLAHYDFAFVLDRGVIVNMKHFDFNKHKCHKSVDIAA